MEVLPAQPQKNTEKMLSIIEQAKIDCVDIVVFSEMAIPGYLIGDMWERESFLRECIECGGKVIDAAENIVVIFGNVAVDYNKKNEDGRVRKYNACFVAEDRKLVGGYGGYNFIIKTLLPNYREFDDNRHFYPYWKLGGDKDIMDFDPVVLKDGYSMGCMLCEDGWDTDYDLSPISALGDQDCCEIFINISCSPYTSGKNDKRNRVFADHAAQYETPLVYVNCIGVQDNGKTIYTFDGNSCVYDWNGNYSHTGKAFEERMPTVSVDGGEVRSYGSSSSSSSDIGEMYNAIRYGTEKFMDRLGIKRVVIGASGGIDSCLVAAIMGDILSYDNILLVNMPSQYNSDTTKNIAEKLAKRMFCNYAITPIEDSVQLTNDQVKYSNIVEESPCTSSDKVPENLTPFMLENVQARDRSSRVLAAWAALFGGAFTCNANKSEMTVGYTTMYGDLGGFLAPISDLWKTQVYEMATFFNQNVRNIIPQEAIDIPPSAELSDGQVDPIRYNYHDLLFKSWVERWDRATPEDILEWERLGNLETELGYYGGVIVQDEFGGSYDAFISDLERWWNFYDGFSFAKRIQAPPVLAVSKRAYGWDLRESQTPPYYSENYHRLKNEFIKS
jgi:NAD+ synthase (glutamine-hydrolysing)